MASALKNVLIGTLLAGGLAGCGDEGRLRMSTAECPGEYREQARLVFGENSFNYVTIPYDYASNPWIENDTVFTFRDYTKRTVDWNNVNAKDELRKDHIDEIVIEAPNSQETITPADSNSNTISGIRARDWLIRGDSLYRKIRECFVDWARRDYWKGRSRA